AAGAVALRRGGLLLLLPPRDVRHDHHLVPSPPGGDGELPAAGAGPAAAVVAPGRRCRTGRPAGAGGLGRAGGGECGRAGGGLRATGGTPAAGRRWAYPPASGPGGGRPSGRPARRRRGPGAGPVATRRSATPRGWSAAARRWRRVRPAAAGPAPPTAPPRRTPPRSPRGRTGHRAAARRRRRREWGSTAGRTAHTRSRTRSPRRTGRRRSPHHCPPVPAPGWRTAGASAAGVAHDPGILIAVTALRLAYRFPHHRSELTSHGDRGADRRELRRGHRARRHRAGGLLGRLVRA